MQEKQSDIEDYQNRWSTVNSKESNDRANHRIGHYQNCINQLQKLKEFEFPTDKEIETFLKNRSSKWDGIEAAKWMREIVKSKLS